MSTPLFSHQKWDAYTTFGLTTRLSTEMTCIGFQGKYNTYHRCASPIFSRDYLQLRKILNHIESQPPEKAEEYLWQIVRLSLCDDSHQKQAFDYETIWKRTIFCVAEQFREGKSVYDEYRMIERCLEEERMAKMKLELEISNIKGHDIGDRPLAVGKDGEVQLFPPSELHDDMNTKEKQSTDTLQPQNLAQESPSDEKAQQIETLKNTISDLQQSLQDSQSQLSTAQEAVKRERILLYQFNEGEKQRKKLQNDIKYAGACNADNAKHTKRLEITLQAQRKSSGVLQQEVEQLKTDTTALIGSAVVESEEETPLLGGGGV